MSRVSAHSPVVPIMQEVFIGAAATGAPTRTFTFTAPSNWPVRWSGDQQAKLVILPKANAEGGEQ